MRERQEEVLRYVRRERRKKVEEGGECSCNKPVGLPSVECVGIVLAEVCRLHVKEVAEVLDGLRQGVALGHGEDCVEEVVHIGLENTLSVR